MIPAKFQALATVLAAALVAPVSAQSLYGPAASNSPTASVQWGTDLDAAKAAARESNKLVLIHFWNPSCGPCRLLDNQVFNQPAVASTVHSQFVPVKINTDESPELAQSLGITAVPTDIVLGSDGKVVSRMTGAAPPMAYIARLTEAVSKVTRSSGAAYQLATATAPYNQQNVNSAYANLAIPSAAATPQASPQAPTQAATPVAPQQSINPYAAGGQYAQQQPQQTGSAAGMMASPSAEPAAPAANGNRYAAAAQLAGEANQPPVEPATADASTPQLPPGAPPVAFDGYCPVTMKKQRRWVKGDAAWGAIHEGRTYLFIGQAERDEFLSSFGEYSPVLSGNDPVVALESGRAVPGKRAFGVDYENRIYLFSTQENLNRFWANPKAYANGLRQASAGRIVR